MKLLNHVLELNFRARNRFTHFRVHRRPYYTHVCWYKVSLLFGQPHLEPITVCADCGEQVSGISAGDEGWTYCEGCQQVEGRTLEITMEEYEART